MCFRERGLTFCRSIKEVIKGEGIVMAHECPECGQICHCGGDIDDCLNNFDEDVMRCTHCPDKDEEEEEEEEAY